MAGESAPTRRSRGLDRGAPWVLAALLLVGALLRVHQYTEVPRDLETYDEYFHAFAGVTLIHEGVPRAWTLVSKRYYENGFWKEWRGGRFFIVEPWFDHPPLFSLLTGAAVTLGGARSMWEVQLAHMRLLPIALSLVTTALVFVVARRLASTELALLASALHAITPIIVVSNRLVKAESLLAALLLACIWACLEYLDSGKRRWLLAAAVGAGLASLAKVLGLALVVVNALLLVSRSRWRDAVVASTISLAIFGLFFAYGAFYDWEIFRRVQGSQASLPLSLQTAFRIILNGRIVLEHVFPFTGLFLWLGAIVGLAPGPGRDLRDLRLALGVYFLTLCGSVGLVYGWYPIPLYPLLVIGAASFLQKTFERPGLLPTAVVALLGVLPIFEVTLGRVSPFGVRAAVLLTLLPALAYEVFDREPWRRAARAGLVLLGVLFVIASVTSVRNLDAVYPAGPAAPPAIWKP